MRGVMRRYQFMMKEKSMDRIDDDGRGRRIEVEEKVRGRCYYLQRDSDGERYRER